MFRRGNPLLSRSAREYLPYEASTTTSTGPLLFAKFLGATANSRRYVHSNDPFTSLVKEHRIAQSLCDKILLDEENAVEEMRELIKAMSIHTTIEEIHVYPLAAQLDDNMKDLNLQLKTEHKGLKTMLADLDDYVHTLEDKEKDRADRPKFPRSLMEDIRKYHIDHTQVEEKELFPKLRQVMERVDLANLNEKLESERNWAPTVPMPNMPGDPTAAKVVSRVAGMVEKVVGSPSDEKQKEAAT